MKLLYYRIVKNVSHITHNDVQVRENEIHLFHCSENRQNEKLHAGFQKQRLQLNIMQGKTI
jgi:hypothetical protein